MKRILIALMASMMVVTTAACGNSGSTSSAPSESSSASSSDVASDDSSAPEESAPEESAPETSSSEAAGDVTANAAAAAIPVPADATDEEKAYIEEVNKVIPLIAAMQEVPENFATDPEAAKTYMEDMKSKCEILGNLQAPEKYADLQAKFSEGSKALIESIDIQVKFLGATAEELAAAENAEELKKLEDLGITVVTSFKEALDLATTSFAGTSTDAPAVEDETSSAAESSSAAE